MNTPSPSSTAPNTAATRAPTTPAPGAGYHPYECGTLPAPGLDEPADAYPSPPDTLENDSVSDVALQYEHERLGDCLDHAAVDYYDVGYFSHLNEATVRNRSDDTVFVRVKATFAFRTPTSDADGVPVVSIYRVTRTTIDRVAVVDHPA